MKRKNIYNRSKLSSSLLDLLFIVLVIVVFIPQFKLIGYYNYIVLLISFLLFLTLIAQAKFLVLLNNRFVKKSIVFVVISVIIPGFVDNILMLNKFVLLSVVFVFYYLYIYNAKFRGNYFNLRLVLISLPIILYSTLVTSFALFQNPYAARMIKASGDDSTTMMANGVSGYSLVYSVLFLLIALIPLWLDRNKIKLKKSYKILLFTLIVIFSILVVLSNYFTAFILIVFAFIFMLLFYKNKWGVILLLPVFVFYLAFRTEVNIVSIEFLMKISPMDGTTYKRLDELRSSILFDIETENIDTRSSALKESLTVISEYPIFGYILGSGGSRSFEISRVSQHSFILDVCALYGLIFGIFTVWLFIYIFKSRMLSNNISQLKVFNFVFGASFFVFIVMNNLAIAVGYSVFFVYPTVFNFLSCKLSGGTFKVD